MYARVLVPLDGSAQGEAILSHIAELASRLGSEVVLLRVVKSALYVEVSEQVHGCVSLLFP